MNNNLSIYAFSSAQKPELLYTVKGFGKLKYALIRISRSYNRRQKFSLTMDNLLRLQKQAPQIVKNQLEQFTLYNYPQCRKMYINTAIDSALLQQLGMDSEQKLILAKPGCSWPCSAAFGLCKTAVRFIAGLPLKAVNVNYTGMCNFLRVD